MTGARCVPPVFVEVELSTVDLKHRSQPPPQQVCPCNDPAAAGHDWHIELERGDQAGRKSLGSLGLGDGVCAVKNVGKCCPELRRIIAGGGRQHVAQLLRGTHLPLDCRGDQRADGRQRVVQQRTVSDGASGGHDRNTAIGNRQSVGGCGAVGASGWTEPHAASFPVLATAAEQQHEVIRWRERAEPERPHSVPPTQRRTSSRDVQASPRPIETDDRARRREHDAVQERSPAPGADCVTRRCASDATSSRLGRSEDSRHLTLQLECA